MFVNNVKVGFESENWENAQQAFSSQAGKAEPGKNFDLPHVASSQSIQNNTPLPVSQQLRTPLMDVIPSPVQQQMGISKPEPLVSQNIPPSSSSAKLDRQSQQLLKGVVDILSSKAFFFETGCLIDAIHVYAEGLFRDAVKEGLLDKTSSCSQLLDLKKICCSIGTLATASDFNHVLTQMLKNNYLSKTIFNLNNFYSGISNNKQLQKLKRQTQNKIISKRQNLIRPLINILQTTEKLTKTEAGLRVLGQKCEEIILLNERAAFNLRHLFETILLRYQIVLGDLEAAASSQVMNYPDLSAIEPGDRGRFVTFCKEFQRCITASYQRFETYAKGTPSAKQMHELYQHLVLICEEINSYELPLGCDQILSGLLAVNNTLWGLTECVSLACDGVSIEVEKRQLSEEEIFQIVHCFESCRDFAIFNSILDWSRFDGLELTLAEAEMDHQDITEIIAMIGRIKQMTQSLADCWTLLFSQSTVTDGIEILQHSRATLDPRDLCNFRGMFFREVDEVITEAVEIVDPLNTVHLLKKLRVCAPAEANKLVMFISVILGGLYGGKNEVVAVRPILGLTRGNEIVIDQTRSELSNASKDQPKQTDLSDDSNAVQDLVKSDTLVDSFETEEALNTFICEMINQPPEAEISQEVIPLEISDQEEETFKKITIEEQHNVPNIVPVEQKPTPKVKKKSKERIDYSGHARSMRNVIARLTKHNYHLVRQKGSHAQMKNPDSGDLITLSNHGKPLCRRGYRDLQTRLDKQEEKSGSRKSMA